MAVLRRRPTALAWYSRVRALNFLLLLPVIFISITLCAKPKLTIKYLTKKNPKKQPLVPVFPLLSAFLAAILAVFEFYSSKWRDIATFRSQLFLGLLITADVIAIVALGGSTIQVKFWNRTGGSLVMGLFCLMIFTTILQIVSMSFVAHEEMLRRRAAKEKDEINKMKVVVGKMRDEEAAQQTQQV